MVIEVNC